MMDKLREEFEKEIKEWYPLAECISKERNISICDLYPIEWSLWQTSSIPEGYVVVPKEPSFTTMQRMNESLINNSDETAKYRMQQIYKAMIEAVEKNDE